MLPPKPPMSRFIYGMITGAAMLYVAMHFHIVRGQEGVFLVPKISNDLSDVYVDVREYSLGDWQAHKPLAAAIMRSQQSHLLDDAALGGFRTNLESLMGSWFGNT